MGHFMSKDKFVINHGAYLKPHYPHPVLALKSCPGALVPVGREEKAGSVCSDTLDIPAGALWIQAEEGPGAGGAARWGK